MHAHYTKNLKYRKYNKQDAIAQRQSQLIFLFISFQFSFYSVYIVMKMLNKYLSFGFITYHFVINLFPSCQNFLSNIYFIIYHTILLTGCIIIYCFSIVGYFSYFVMLACHLCASTFVYISDYLLHRLLNIELQVLEMAIFLRFQVYIVKSLSNTFSLPPSVYKITHFITPFPARLIN